MRHGMANKRLNRTSEHRKALLKNMLNSLVKYEQIKTTLPKAKELRKFIEPLVTLGKDDSVAHRRIAFNRLRSDDAVGKLFTVISVNAKDRNGGYTRIIKAGFRPGDKADMAFIEFVDRKSDEESDVEKDSAA